MPARLLSATLPAAVLPALGSVPNRHRIAVPHIQDGDEIGVGFAAVIMLVGDWTAAKAVRFEYNRMDGWTQYNLGGTIVQVYSTILKRHLLQAAALQLLATTCVRVSSQSQTVVYISCSALLLTPAAPSAAGPLGSVLLRRTRDCQTRAVAGRGTGSREGLHDTPRERVGARGSAGVRARPGGHAGKFRQHHTVIRYHWVSSSSDIYACRCQSRQSCTKGIAVLLLRC